MREEDVEIRWLRRVRDLSHRLAAESDPERLFSMILDAAIELSDAERGFLVLVKPGKDRAARQRFSVKVARGFHRTDLEGGRGKVSRTIVSRVLESGASLVTSREEDEDVVGVTSVQRRRVRSVVSVPLRLRGEILGVLYLDHRFVRDAFHEEQLPFLEAFADQASLALETARLLSARFVREQRTSAALHELDQLKAAQEGSEEAGERTLPQLETIPRFGRLVGGAPAMQELYTWIERVSPSHAPVLIWGESGTGKELVAREVHERGEGTEQPFLAENCAAIAEGLLESELFGHERGSFTDAHARRQGLFLRAGKGSLFLDEVGDMSLSMQRKLLRVIQERRVRPIGGDRDHPVHCRVITASHKDLRTLVAEGVFREDLYYRLDVLRVQVPPLRARREDIPALVSHFLSNESSQIDFSPEALAALVAYSWPGNVRELENELRRLLSLGRARIAEGDLSREIRLPGGGGGRETMEAVERKMVVAALAETGGNKARAARRLGIPRSTLYHLLERFGLS